MADFLSILLALELLDDYEVEISEVLDEDNDITLFSVGSSYMRRNLNRVRDYFEGTIPLYFPDEFKGHFRMTRETCELFTRAVMPTGRIPLGNGSGRAAIPPPKLSSGAVEELEAIMSSISGLWDAGREQEWSNGTEFSGYSDFPEF